MVALTESATMKLNPKAGVREDESVDNAAPRDLLSIVGKSQKTRQHPLADPRAQIERLAQLALKPSFEAAVAGSALPGHTLAAVAVEVLQINVGKKCNQSCKHCHVDAGPDREEEMSDDVVEACLRVLERSGMGTLDITGGAPELHPRFEEMVRRATALGRHVIDRCNLTILRTAKYRHLPAFFAEHKVEVVCSLPYHSASSTDAQRGDGVYEKSIAALQELNALGYGRPGSGLNLVLVANPVGAFLPAPQADQEAEFRRRLLQKHGVVFNQLFTITNLPISRYLEWLEDSGNLVAYMNKLVSAFNPAALEGVMCRRMVSVGWQGELYDCDFNQMLELPIKDVGVATVEAWADELTQSTAKESTAKGSARHAGLASRSIVTGAHCFGCTAGQGSSCGGATA